MHPQPNTALASLTANFVGKAIIAGASFAALPWMYQLMQGDGQGLIGFYASALALVTLLDFGVSAAMQHRFARSDDPSLETAEQKPANVMRSLEQCLLLVALVVCVGTVGGSDWIATQWLKIDTFSVEQAANCVSAIGIAATGQLVAAFYGGCLNGMRAVVRLNFVQSVMVLLRLSGGLIAAGAMGWVQTTPADHALMVFGLWGAVNWGNAILLRMQCLPAKAEFFVVRKMDFSDLIFSLKFGLGMVGITILITLINQVDKLAASKYLSLSHLGGYMMMWALLEIFALLYQPIYLTVVPLMARSFDSTQLTSIVAKSCALMALLTSPLLATFCAMPSEVLIAWTGDAHVAGQWAGLLPFLTVTATANAYLFVFFALQQSGAEALRGWIWIIVRLFPIYIASSAFSISIAGVIGAACSWAIFSLLLGGVLIRYSMRSYSLTMSLYQLLVLIFRSIFPCLLVALIFLSLAQHADSRIEALALVGACLVLTSCVSAFVHREVIVTGWQILQKRREPFEVRP